MRNGDQHARGFTLVEILIVVIILGILASIVIPQFANASSDARTTNLRTTLANVRNQVEVFKTQHNENYPDIGVMWSIMLGPSDTTEYSSANPTGTAWGPYLQAAPINPYNSLTGLSGNTTDPSCGWYYAPANVGFKFFARSIDGTTISTY